MPLLRSGFAATLASLSIACFLPGQELQTTYSDLLLTRNRPTAYEELLQIKGGLQGNLPDDEDKAVGREKKFFPGGSVFYRNDRLFSAESGARLYAGFDGFYGAATQGNIKTDGKETRIELFGRVWPFYREGFYQNKDFVPTARYEGQDFGGRLGFASQMREGLMFEMSTRYEHRSFDRNDQTTPAFVIPGDYNAFVPRVTLEQSTVALDRRTGWPIGGFLATAYMEYEFNDSNDTFGSVGRVSELPRQILRGAGNIEYYYMTSESVILEIKLSGEITDKDDRIRIYDAQKPIGSIWLDGELGFRLMLGETFGFTPGIKGQWVRIADEFGDKNEDKFFVGGFARLRWDVSDSVSMIGDWSYLTNQSRPPISIQEDTFGEQRFFIGLAVRLGGR